MESTDLEKVKVSVKCIVYNHEKYLYECLNSLVNQKTNFRFEIVIHDDASTDKSRQIIEAFAKKYDSIIKPIYETENQYSKGVQIISKIIFKECSGDFLAICEGDDYWTDEYKLQKQYDALMCNTGCSICSHITRCIKADGTPLDATIPRKVHSKTILDAEDFMINEFTPPGWAAHTSSFFIRREVVEELYCRTPRFAQIAKVGDLPTALLAFNYGKMFFIHEEMSCYRTFSGGFNSQLKSSKRNSLEYWKNCIDYLTEYDIFTNHRYHKYINPYLNSRRFDICIAQKKYFISLLKFPRLFLQAGIKKIKKIANV